jgi:hypothetical protein
MDKPIRQVLNLYLKWVFKGRIDLRRIGTTKLRQLILQSLKRYFAGLIYPGKSTYSELWNEKIKSNSGQAEQL